MRHALDTVPARCEHPDCREWASSILGHLCPAHGLRYAVEDGDDARAFAIADDHGLTRGTVLRAKRDVAERAMGFATKRVAA